MELVTRFLNHHGVSRIQVYCICALLNLAAHGCAPIPTFPIPGVTIIQNSQDFDDIKNQSQQFHDHSFQLAGRIKGTDTTPTGVRFLAEWLPFPADTYSGPETRSLPRTYRPFYLHFSGPVDDDGKSQGNEFLMVGHLTGLEDMVTLAGNTKAIPSFTAQCFHVWKTAFTDLYEFIWMGPLSMRYPPPLEETYCVASSPSKNP